MTDKKMNIYAKLFEIQQRLKVNKSLYSEYGKFHYRSAETILQAVKPILQDIGMIILFEDEIKQLFEESDTLYKYVFSTVKLIDIESKEELKATAFAREPLQKKGMDECQITGSTMSYARKYAMGALFAIDDGQDSDSYVPVQEPEKKAPPKAKSEPTITREEAEELYRLSGESGEIENIMKEYKYDRMGTIPKKMYSKIRNKIIENTTKAEDLENE